MSKGFSINDILGNTKANAPAGQKMQVVMLPAADIEPNPENSIYEIGDVSMLKADIAERGLRSPLEVLPAQNGKYMLLAGHRRWTACRALTAEGVAGFEVLPCVIRQSQGEDDDLIALITSNATARELTDGERLRQYRALKQALERKKAAGALDGRIRDEMSRITGDGTGTLGRLNAIANNCVPEVLAMVERGEITMTRAYECSKLYKVQQVEYAKIKYASMPPPRALELNAELDNGMELNGAVTFEKRDDRTFVTGINYELFLAPDDLAGHTATLTLSNLMACNKSIVETDGKSYWHYDYADQTPLPGTYTLTFTIPEVSDAGVRTMSTPVEQDGVTLQSVRATPAATKVLLTFPPEQHWVNVRLFTEDGTELGHERGEGGWWTDGAWTADPADFDHPEQCTKASYDYFAAVPENCHSLTVKVYDFDTDAELTTFTAELP